MLNIGPDEFHEYFNKGISFSDFVNGIRDTEKEDHAKRIRINYKRAKIPPDIQDKLNNLEYRVKLLVLAAGWCWDCQTSLPVIAKMAESEKIDLRILVKEDFPGLVRKINGGEKIPQVHFFSEDGYYVTTWVEKPVMAYKIYSKLRKELGWDADKYEFIKSYRKEFMQNSAKIRDETLHELLTILDKTQAIFASSPRLNKEST
ncbi:MAG: thioredoxin family protein [Candidatus Hodarchaeales archaeon]